RAGATPTPMMLRLRPRAISPTRTATLPVPISTAPIILLLLEITFGFTLGRLNGKFGTDRRGQLIRGTGQLDRNLALEREVDGLQVGLGQHLRGIDHVIELGHLLV